VTLGSNARGSRRALSADVWVARTIEDVEAVRPLWQAAQGGPQSGSFTADIDVFLANVRFNPDVVRPHVLVVEKNGETSLVVAHLRQVPYEYRFRNVAMRGPRIRLIDVVPGGCLRLTTQDHARGVIAELRRSLVTSEADALVLRSLDRGGPIWSAAMADTPGLLRRGDPRPEARHTLRLSGSLDEILAVRSAKLRENIRRCLRRVEELAGDVELRLFTDEADVPALFSQVDAVAARSRRRHGRLVFADSELERRLVELGLARGWFRAYVLSLGGEPAAFWTGFAYGRTFGWRGVTGYDDEHRALGVGTYTLARMLDQLCREPSVDRFDFGSGDARYKQLLADSVRYEETLRIFGTHSRPLWVNLGASMLNGAKRVAYRALASNVEGGATLPGRAAP
jgi:CelD/BcsL family acetyltransferase involved in cellulose biosynthesis